MSVDGACIGVFAEGRAENGGTGVLKGVGGQVDGFGGSVGDADGGRIDTQVFRQSLFQRVGLRFRIVADGVEALTQVCLQRLQIHVVVYVRAEVRTNGPLEAESIVSMSADHLFPRKMSYRRGMSTYFLTWAASLSYCSSLKAW